MSAARSQRIEGDTLANLVERFGCTDQEASVALKVARGHGGRAAALLQEHGEYILYRFRDYLMINGEIATPAAEASVSVLRFHDTPATTAKGYDSPAGATPRSRVKSSMSPRWRVAGCANICTKKN